MDEALTWTTCEFKNRKRTPDWYWILGIVAATLIILSILFGNVLFGVVIATGAMAIVLITLREHEEFSFTLSHKGLQINSTLYRFENMISFSILEYIDPNIPPTLSIKTKSILAPQLIIPLTDVDPVDVYEILEAHVDFDMHNQGFIERVVDFLGL